MAKPLFEEKQRWPWVLYVLLVGVLVLPFIEDDRGFEFVIATTCMFVVVIPLMGFRMRTTVHRNGVTVAYGPLKRTIANREIESVEARTYQPIREFGGWGWRGSRKNRAYNIRGNRGVQLELTRERRLLIGSQRADELAAAIESARAPV